MQIKRFAVLTAALVLILSSATVSAAKDHQGKDRIAIETLMWHYARALDTFNADAYVACYTRDGSFKSARYKIKGRKALWSMINNFKKDRAERRAKGEKVPPMYHMNADTWIEFLSPTHALHHTYWFTVVSGTGAKSPTRVIEAGVGVDEVVKVDGHWLIKNRDVAPQN